MMNHPSKEGGLFVSTPIQNIFDICNYLRKIYLDFSFFLAIFENVIKMLGKQFSR